MSDWRRLSDVSLSAWRLYVAYIRPKSRTERPRRLKLAHVNRTQLSRSKGQRSRSQGRRHIVSASSTGCLYMQCTYWRGNLILINLESLLSVHSGFCWLIWPAASASEVTTVWCCRNSIITIIIICRTLYGLLRFPFVLYASDSNLWMFREWFG